MSELEPLLHRSDWLRRLAARLVGDLSAAEDLVQGAWVAAGVELARLVVGP